MSGKVLLVEDDDRLADHIIAGLAEAGYTVDRAGDGRDGLFLASDNGYTAIILDRMLPGMDGLSVLKALRAAQVSAAIILLSALGSTDERVEGLSAGADDYVAKPFAFSELLARLQAVCRRSGVQQAGAPTRLVCGDLVLDRMKRTVQRASRSVAVQAREFKLLEYLMLHSDELVTRTMLLEHVWGYHFDPSTNVIDVHVSRLRRKLEDAGGPPLIQTVRGAGYRMVAG